MSWSLALDERRPPTRALAAAILVPQVLAFWPVWRWYAARLGGSPDEAWGLLALVTAVILLARRERTPDAVLPDLTVPVACVLVYTATYWHIPPIFRAAIAVVSLGYTASVTLTGRRPHLHHCGLLLLSLPVIASLQFYFGFPLRAFTAAAASRLLALNGFHVVRDGTALNWAGRVILVDAPCSGVRMLWAGLFLSLALAALYRFNHTRTVMLVAIAAGIVVAGNVVRASALFYLETGLFPAPEWTHEGTGVVVFAGSAVGIAVLARTIAGRFSWSKTSST